MDTNNIRTGHTSPNEVCKYQTAFGLKYKKNIDKNEKE